MTGKKPKYSIVTSTYNQLDMLKRVKKGLDKQTLKDFEWIIADDGSTDEVSTWTRENNIKYIWQKDDGYDLVGILNKASTLVEGDYMVWIMADTKPTPEFLEKLDEVVRDDRVVTGLRKNVTKKGRFVSPDWRIHNVSPSGRNALKIQHNNPWISMTLNTMCMPTLMFNEMGGIYPEYKGYGRMDWDMAMWAHFKGYELWWATEAIAEHIDHEDREDTPENIKVYEERYADLKSNAGS